MKLNLLRTCTLGLVLSVGASAFAQEIPFILTARPKNTFSVGLRMKAGGAAVSFGNLGTIGVRDPAVRGANGEVIGYQFVDGSVVVETGERAVATNQQNLDRGLVVFNADRTRFQIFRFIPKLNDAGQPVIENGQQVFDKAGRLEQDLLAYQPGLTRDWAYTNASQVVGGSIEMHNYGARTEGAGFESDSDSNGGFDLQFTREIGLIGKKGSWGFAASVGLVDINAKTSGKVMSTLITQSTRFGLNGQTAPNAPFNSALDGLGNGPQQLDEDGKPVTTTDTSGATVPVYTKYETTVPLQSTPSPTTYTETASGTEIDGRWQLKGSYYSIRVGPTFRYQFNRRLSALVTAGVSAAYIGTTYDVRETIFNPTSTTTPLSTLEVKRRQSEVLFGGYGELVLEFWLSYRTGLFAGLVYENLGTFDQYLGGRSARVNIGDGTSFRIGVVTRF